MHHLIFLLALPSGAAMVAILVVLLILFVPFKLGQLYERHQNDKRK